MTCSRSGSHPVIQGNVEQHPPERRHCPDNGHFATGRRFAGQSPYGRRNACPRSVGYDSYSEWHAVAAAAADR